MNIIVSGTRGEGKSTLSLWLARQFADTVVVLDPRGTFSAVGIECADLEDLFDNIQDKSYLKGDGKPKPLVCSFDEPTADSVAAILPRLFPLRFTFRGKIALVVDEARELQSPHWIDPHLNRLIRQAPQDRVCVIQNTHQMMDWNSATKSVTDDFYIFRQLGPRNRKVMEEHFGQDVADIAANLPQHHLIHYWYDRRNGKDNTFDVWDEPSKWYEQISDTPNLPVSLADATGDSGELDDTEAVRA